MRSALGSDKWNYLLDSTDEHNPIPSLSTAFEGVRCNETRDTTPKALEVLERQQLIDGAREAAVAAASPLQLDVLAQLADESWEWREFKLPKSKEAEAYKNGYSFVRAGTRGRVEVGKMFRRTKTYEEIGEILHVSTQAVYRAVVQLKKAGLL